MRNIINDFKVISITLLFSLIYFSLTIEKFDILKILYIIDIITIVSFSVNIIFMVIIYPIRLKDIKNVDKYLTITFCSIGIISCAHNCFEKQFINNINYISSYLSLDMLSAIFQTCFMIYCFSRVNNKINYKKFFGIVISITIIIVFLSLLSGVFLINAIQSNNVKVMMQAINLLGIILNIYLLRLINLKKEHLAEIINIYLKKYVYLKIACIISNMIILTDINYGINIIHYIMEILSNYCIIKIVIVEIIKKPNKEIYYKLIKKSDELETTVEKLKKTIQDKDILFDNFEKKTKQEEIRNEILTNISHEFKTPVNVIYSAVQTQDLIKEKASIDEILKYNKIIKQNCNRLTRLINNFIDTSRFNKDNVGGEFVCENIVEITEYLTTAVVPFAKSKRLNLIFDTSDEELYSSIDKELYDRLILNLLSNSIKYSRSNGNIKVEIKDLGEFIEILVEDDGIGIDKYNLKDIFSLFERVDKSYSRNTEGCGLGLNIVKNIVDIHNGTIKIDSVKEEGTKVFVKLPKCDNKYKEDTDMCHRLEDNKYVKYEVEVEMSDIY